MTETRTKKVGEIIRGIALRNQYKFFDMDAEDLESELWIRVCEVEADKGEELDPDLIAKICYRKIVDMQRAGMRQKRAGSIPCDIESLFDRDDDDEEVLARTPEGLISGFDFESKVSIDNLYKIFPEGSKENLFLKFWATYAGIADFGFPITLHPETQLAKMLGFSGTSHRAYKRFRYSMRCFIAEYFGIEM